MTLFDAANRSSRTLADLPDYIREPEHDWITDWRTLAARAQRLVCNDAFCAAMVAAKLKGEQGSQGLRLRSLAAQEPTTAPSMAERELRRRIETYIDGARGRDFDAAGLLTRRKFEQAISWCATVLGEGWGVRTLVSTLSRYATRWRLIRPHRICNPDFRPNDDRLYEGLEYDDAGIWVAIHVMEGSTGAFGFVEKPRWVRIPLRNSDGTPNVIRRTGFMVPGMPRGVSMFAPILGPIRQVGATMDAHTLGKRVQAQQPIDYTTEDPKAAATALGDKFAPLRILIHDNKSTLKFLAPQYDGKDLEDFVMICYRVLTASWNMPVEVALHQMGEASLASARAGLDDFNTTANGWQEDQIEEVTAPIDESLIREGVATDVLQPGSLGITGLCAGRYTRPPRFSTDLVKDASAAKTLINDVRRSRTAVFAMFGWEWEDDQEERVREDQFLGTLGLDDSTTSDQSTDTETSAAASDAQPTEQPAQEATA
jgi:capsid protein